MRRRLIPLVALAIAVPLLASSPRARAQDHPTIHPTAASASAEAFDASAWREDLALLARELPARHPDAFYRMSLASWDSAVGAIDARLPSMTRNEAIVAFMGLVAMVNDGHTSINPLFDPALAIRSYPFELRRFEDGVFVRSAAPGYERLAGAKVLRFGRANVDDALAAAARIVSHENEWWADAWAPAWLGLAEIVDGLGLVEDMEALPLVVEKDGREETVVVHPVGRFEPAGHGGAPIARSGWTDMRGAGAEPLWLRNPERVYWSEFLPEDGTLYVSYRGVIDLGPPLTNAEFWRRTFAMADSLPVERLVLDIRDNGGGNNFFNRQVIRGIVARPELDRPDRLFVVIGPRTFSAAMNFALDLEHWTNATFVGEPTGNAAMFYGDAEELVLPASGFRVNVSSLPWRPYDPRDRRDFLAPDLFAPLTAADYRANVDPAMRAIREAAGTPPLAERMEAAVVAGNVDEAARILAEAIEAPVNRFRTPEAEVNTLGYELLRGGNTDAAIAVFRLNTDAFPRSANVWDSLGEALLAAGRRDESIAAYRRALELDPEFVSARLALERLGVAPPGHD